MLLTLFVRSLLALALNVLSQLTLHVLPRLKLPVTAAYVVLSFTTCGLVAVRLLVSQNVVVNSDNESETALHFARQFYFCQKIIRSKTLFFD